MRFHYVTSNIIITKIILITTIVLILSNTNTITYSTPQPNADSLIFEDSEIGVKFEYPNDWIREGSFLYGPESDVHHYHVIDYLKYLLVRMHLFMKAFLLKII